MILNCPFCRTQVKPDQKDCPECTQRMIRSCPNCAEDISVLAKLCKYCGEPVERAEAPAKQDIVFIESPGPSRTQPGDGGHAVAGTVPWEEKGGFLRRWWGTVKQASFHPVEFMRAVKGGGYGKAIGFLYGMFVQALLVAVIVGAAVGTGLALSGVRIPRRDLLHGLAVVLVSIPISYLAIVAFSFAAAGFWHAMARLAGGTGSFRDSFRMVAYSFSSAPWALVPLGGKPLQLFFQGMMLFHGFREVHGLSKRRAVLALVMPAIVLFAIVGTVAIVAVAAHVGAQA